MEKHELQVVIEELHERYKPLAEGQVATYIPELSKADPEAFGIALVSSEGQVFQTGDCDVPFTIQSISKPVLYAAALADRRAEHTVESSMAKLYASEVAVRAANAAVQVHGGYGYVDEYPVGKYLRDARVTTLYEGTSQIQKLIIGRALTGESAFT